MFVDVLKRYLLIVWNFFFGQVSSESIQDSPSHSNDQPADLADIVPPVEVDSNDAILNEDLDDDIIEIFDDDEEGVEEEEEEEEEDEDEGVILHKKQEDKNIINDIPTKPAEVKVPEMPKSKENVDISKPESPKVNDVEPKEKEKPKTESDETEKNKDVEVKKEEIPKLKPTVELNDKSKFEFEIIERESDGVVSEEDQVKSKPDVEENDSSKLPAGKSTTSHNTFEEDEKKYTTDEKKDEIRVQPKADDHIQKPDAGVTVGSREGPATSAGTKILKPADLDGKTAQRENNEKFVVLEKGDGEGATDKVDGLKKTDDTIDSFLLGEQTHSGRLLTHPESIQDQQLDYSDSGEELSDDDIEIDYEDDEEDDDEDDEEEVEEVKPLPPVARSVYKKND